MRVAEDEPRDRIPIPPPLVRPNHTIDLSLRTAVRRHIVTVLMHTDGSQVWAASELGISTSTLYRILRDWDGRRDRRTSVARPREVAEAELEFAGAGA